jgi:hypothetical protein
MCGDKKTSKLKKKLEPVLLYGFKQKIGTRDSLFSTANGFVSHLPEVCAHKNQ